MNANGNRLTGGNATLRILRVPDKRRIIDAKQFGGRCCAVQAPEGHAAKLEISGDVRPRHARGHARVLRLTRHEFPRL